jgi:hypothetical protein
MEIIGLAAILEANKGNKLKVTYLRGFRERR